MPEFVWLVQRRLVALLISRHVNEFGFLVTLSLNLSDLRRRRVFVCNGSHPRIALVAVNEREAVNFVSLMAVYPSLIH
jgi:hypothetical protein